MGLLIEMYYFTSLYNCHTIRVLLGLADDTDFFQNVTQNPYEAKSLKFGGADYV